MRRLALYLVRWLVRNRVILFIGTLAVAVFCALMIPNININSDMTRYLPESYSMKQGMTILDTDLAGLKDQAQGFDTTFSSGLDTLPKGLGKTLIFGVAIVFAVLLAMCSSVLEVVVFLITIGVAVLINVGSNALLNSVSLTTNTISPVLQMVLSMDYCIILMNRYRQERMTGKQPVSAMNLAVGGTASSILSSAFTTIVSLLMLCFIKLKIGADLGGVLAKGVAISLICTFTLLPALIIWCGKAIEATRKKIPVLPAAALSRFEYRFRIPIAILFVITAVGFTLLQRRTPIFFAPPQWEKTDSTGTAQKVNPMLLIYSTAEEDAIPALLDSIATDPKVTTCISYPSLADKPRTAEEMEALFTLYAGDQAGAIPDGMLKLVYYAQAHPERTETFSLKTLQQSADELRRSGLVPEDKDIDFEKLIRKSFSSSSRKSSHKTTVAAAHVTTPAAAADTATVPDTVIAASDTLRTQGEDTAPISVTAPATGLTYEAITTPLTAGEMAALMDSDPKQVGLLYRMAGKRGDKMTPVEFITYVKKNILGKKKYAMFLPKNAERDLNNTAALYDSILKAGPTKTTAEAAPQQPAEKTDTSAVFAQASEILANPSVTPPAEKTSDGAKSFITRPVEEPKYTAMDALLDMYLSGKAYSSGKIYKALSNCRVPVTRDEIDLMFLYTAASRDEGPGQALSPVKLLDFLADTLLVSPVFSAFVDDSTLVQVTSAREQLLSGVGSLRGEKYSAAAVLSGYEVESDSSFAYVERVNVLADNALQQEHYWVGESEMYKELKDGFPKELLLLTLLTVLSIFIIVAINFRSALIPIPLVMTVLAGVYANVWASGLGGRSMYYLSYLIVQGILMGATIDYSILFTTCYLASRQKLGSRGALEAAFNGSSHSILTSGTILAFAPLVMSFTMPDLLVASILKSLSLGALAALLFILFLLPGVLACLDPLIKPRKKFRPRKNEQ